MGQVISNSLTIGDGQTSSGLTVAAGGQVFVLSGGVASDTTVNSSGVDILSGGTTYGTFLVGGTEVLSAGATYGTVVSGNGAQYLSGGTAYDTLVLDLLSSGGQYVAPGGVASDAVVSSGGAQFVSGGMTYGTLISNGGFEVVSAGGAYDTVVDNGGEEVVSGGGAFSTVVSDGGTEVISGGAAYSTVVSAGGSAAILSGGDIFGATIAGGTLEIESGGTNDSGTVGFAGSSTLIIDQGTPSFVVSGFAAGDTVDFAALAPASVSVITSGGNTLIGGVTFAGTFASGAVSLAPDGDGGTLVTVCYVAGTRIATPSGATPVEALRPGDMVLACVDGAWVAQKVRWVGEMSIDLARHAEPARAAPIRIRADAVAPGVPLRDLLVSPDHAVFLDGALFQAQALVNGATIVREPPRGRVTYLHVELDRHALLLAEGMPAESYLDTGNRAWFAREAGVRPLCPDLAAPRTWAADACAPLVLAGPALAEVHARLRRRAVELGYVRTADPALRVLADGAEVPRTELAPLHWCARLPAGTGAVRLLTRCFAPTDDDPAAPDHRQLGLAVAALLLDGRVLPLSAFGAGWHAAEPDWRWTDGDAHLRLPPSRDARALEIRAAAAAPGYWNADGAARHAGQRAA